MTSRPPTVKQTKFVKAYVENGGNGTQAALSAYDTNDYDTANQIAVENLQKPTVKAAIEAALEKHGITIEKATKPIADGLTASTDFYDKNGALVSKPDHSTRLKASGMALKLMGADQKQDQTQGNTINFINNANFKSDKYVD